MLNRLKAASAKRIFSILVIIALIAIFGVPYAIEMAQKYRLERGHVGFHLKLKNALKLIQGNNLMKNYDTTEDFVYNFKQYVKATKVCETTNLTDCFPDALVTFDGSSAVAIPNGLRLSDLMDLNGYQRDTNVMGIIMADNTSMLIAYHTDCGASTQYSEEIPIDCISMIYDVNALEKPNKINLDVNFIQLMGTENQQATLSKLKDIGKINAPKFGK